MGRSEFVLKTGEEEEYTECTSPVTCSCPSMDEKHDSRSEFDSRRTLRTQRRGIIQARRSRVLRSLLGWKHVFYLTLWMVLLLVKHGTCQDGGLSQEFDIPEEVEVGTVIGTIGVGQPDLASAPPPYLFYFNSNDAKDDIEISSQGEIKVKGRLDRETRNFYQLVAVSTTQGKNIRVMIHVTDVNDHSPQFPMEVKSLKLSESTPKDAKYPLGSAVDPDLGVNAVQRYEIVSGNTGSVFQLESNRAQNGILYLDLKITRQLDYEETPSYLLVIHAVDGGTPPKHGSIQVNITIADANDNQPIFNQSRYFARIAENATIGTSVLQVFATDRDSGENGRIIYQIDRQRSDPEENFNINPTSGVISVNNELDYETKTAYELIVVARDNGTQKLQTTAIVSITISDVNDNEPRINLIFLTDDGTGRISERSSPGDFIARISVSDPDVDSELVNVTLTGGDGHFGLQTRDNIVYLVILSKPIDRELRPVYTLLVTAMDSGVPPLQSTKSFSLHIIDVNDNAPEFSQSTYYADIQEVVPPGSSVIQLTAVDRDADINSVVTYEILQTLDTHTDWFQIDNRTGLITTKMKVDCEALSEPRLVVVAHDSGIPSLSGSTTVIVRIWDVNDNQPVFDQSFYNVSVLENAAVGDCVLTVQASDPDCGTDAQVRYSVATNLGFQYPQEFEVRETTGEVCLVQPLDFENKNVYDFPVLAKDQDDLDTTAMVKITVKDVNDNRPVFYPARYTVNIDQDSEVHTEVVVVQATDEDSGDYGKIEYHIISGNQNGLFSINSNSGVVKLSTALPSSPKLYSLVVAARDGGGLEAPVNAEVTLSIVDSAQNPPEFTLSMYTFSIREDAGEHSLVGQVEATTSSGSVMYTVVSGDPNGFFEISSSTGEIRTMGRLDHDTVPSVLLNVQAQAGTPPTYGQAQVSIAISDVNDNAPRFDVSLIEIPVKEDLTLTSTVYAVRAIDRDSGNNGVVRYSVEDPTASFTIDPTTGIITLLQRLDYEQRQKHQLTITAYDLGVNSKKSTLTIVVNVQDVNDNAPSFSAASYNFAVSESVAVNDKFAQVSARDDDSGNNGRITYLLQNGDNMDVFGVFANDGFLYNKVPLDREEKDSYTLEVVAVDSGSQPKSSTAQITIRILDTNDNHPKFTQSTYNFYVEENRPPHTQVGFVSATDSDQSSELAYTLASTSSYFRLGRSSGEIVSLQRLDREARDVHDLVVQVSDQGKPNARTAAVKVKVTVLDVNDNSPVFAHQGHFNAYIKEQQPKGSLVLQVSATDRDRGNNSTITYSVVPDPNVDSSMFKIHPTSGRITTNEVLDHESKSQYAFKISAQDGGAPPRKVTQTVEVVIEDENVSPPQFEKTHITFSVHENTPTGTIVGSVKAKDKDSGQNGQVSYYIVWGNLFGTFGVNRTTGSIFISEPVDYEECSAYSIQIRAVDNNPVNPMSDIINVNITIIDVNDNPPVFEENPVVISVRENIPENFHIYTLTAVDLDSGPRGQIKYTIQMQSPPGDWFGIDAATGFLRTNRVIDYETTSQVSVVVKATDQPGQSDGQLFSTVTALVLIEDVNDNAPKFQSRSEVDIFEDEPVGYPIMHCITVDEDSHENGLVSYAIVSGNEENYFNLDPESGLLSISKMLDREEQVLYQLNISASDHGHPRHVTYALLSAHVVDVNDNAPVFLHSVYKASVRENQPVGSNVTVISATDRDTGANAELQYLIPSGIGNSHFKVDPVTGRITTNVTLDREERDSWVITAYVRDNTFPALYDTTTVIVEVLDANDNSPTFKDPVYYLEVPENAHLSIIHTVMAMDGDAGVNGQVQYSIVGGNDDGRFTIDSLSGQLSCSPLDRELTSLYNLTIRATDRGLAPRSRLAAILIKVLDVNDNDPRFRQPLYSESIPENVAVGTSVLKVEAYDVDEGVNAVLSYSLANSAQGQFKIDNVTGIIYTARDFDREKMDSYGFEVFAIDGGLYGPRSRNVHVDITITDINDNTPIFKEIPYKAEISQDFGVNQHIVQVTAQDKDVGKNGRVVYSLAAPSMYFKIDEDTGAIRSKKLLADPGAVMVHRLEVIARDMGESPKNSSGVVEIQVGNAQGASTLRFSNLTYNVHLDEHSPEGATVVDVEARFVSGGPGSIAYSFASGNEDNMFTVDPVTGVIKVRDPTKLDYELDHRLRLIVVATADNAYGYTTVWINLRDINDNSPRFTQDRYTSAVWEGNTRGTYVTQVTASDSDEGANGHVTYSIVDGNIQDAFVIDPPNTGIVSTHIILDREIVSAYRLVIEAVDSGNPPRTTTCILKIQVIDENDNAPYFPPYQPVHLREGTELGTMILQVTANDNDLNPSLTYQFLPGGNPNNTFSIDLYSGKIAVADHLDYEYKSKYLLKLMASDQKHNATTEVIVNIVDENDNAPEFSEVSYQVTIPEMTSAHVSVITVSASDRDSGTNAQLTYSMAAIEGFYINTQTGMISTNRTVAFNPSQPTINLVVTAKDHGKPSRYAIVAVRVQVMDINNHAPRFTPATYRVEVAENMDKGSAIVRVTATDDDNMHDNKKIDYTIISGNGEAVFQIAPSGGEGEILLVGGLDHERTQEYTLHVMAKDRGEPQLSSTAEVHILVKDINDNSPEFNQSEYHASINESTSISHNVVQVFAFDQDTGLNGRVEYRIASGNDYNSFDIDRDSGVISVRSKLNHETQDIHRLIVKATDSSAEYSKKSAFTTVIINVTDDNEFSPSFPSLLYLESVLELRDPGTFVFTAHANDKDGGYYGIVEYSLAYSPRDVDRSFDINHHTGDVVTTRVFEYTPTQSYHFSVVATDKGGRSASVSVLVKIEPQVKPKFKAVKYNFDIPGNARKGQWLGRVSATDKDGKLSPHIRFSFKEEQEYFGINTTSGDMYVIKDLQAKDDISSENQDRQRRDVALTRQRRALKQDNITLVVVASAGAYNLGHVAETTIYVTVDRTCPGCALGQTGVDDTVGLSGTPLVLIIVFLVIAVILVVVIVVMYLRGRDRKRKNLQPANYDSSSFETLADIPPPPARNFAPPPYSERNGFGQHLHNHIITTSEVSDQSHSASSGRGSAEEADDIDEEIRMINATPQQAQGLRMPDSGIQQDDDAISEHSVHNHQEYLARLGIDTSKMKISKKGPGITSSVESMHQFSDEGGGEGDGMDIDHLVFSKLGEVQADENMAVMDGTREFGYGGETEPSHAGSLSSVINSEEEFSGSYNWDYLLDWGPQYQPLAHVFTEIARLKDETIKPKTKPTQIVPQTRGGLNPTQLRTGGPPPIITGAPPRVMPLHQPAAQPNQSQTSQSISLSNLSSSSNSNTLNSARTSQLTSVSLPKSPMSYESSFTSPAMSPSFTPSLSPLATRSPSISPLVTPKGIGSSGPSTGHNTPNRLPGRRANIHTLVLPQGSSGSEQEIQI